MARPAKARAGWLGWLIAMIACGTPAPPVTRAELVIARVAVIDVVDGRVVADRDVEISGGSIARIAPGGTSRGVRVIDGRGKFVVPGYIEMHAHVLLHPWGADGRIAATVDRSASLAMLRALLANGITTVRDPGAETEQAVALRAELARHAVSGPRLVIAGRMLEPSDVGVEPFVRVTTQAAVRAEVARQAAAGVDWIKLYAGMPPDLCAAAIAEAHGRHLRVVGHLGHTSWTDAARLGIDTLEHPAPWSAGYLPEASRDELPAGLFGRVYWLAHLELGAAPVVELASELVRHHVVVDPTLIAMHSKLWGDDPRYMRAPALALAPQSFVRGWARGSFTADWTAEQYVAARAQWPKLVAFVRMLFDAGVTLTVGTDTPTPWIVPGVSYHQELRLLAEAGIPASALVRMATINGARALGLEAELGTVEVGKRADLVILGANPLADAANLAVIEHVLQAGEEVTR